MPLRGITGYLFTRGIHIYPKKSCQVLAKNKLPLGGGEVGVTKVLLQVCRHLETRRGPGSGNRVSLFRTGH